MKILGTQRGTGEQERSLCMIKTTGLGGVVSDGWVGDRLVTVSYTHLTLPTT